MVLKIALVDDDINFINIEKEIIDFNFGSKVSVSTFFSEKKFLNKLVYEEYDIVFLDYLMSESNAYDILSKLDTYSSQPYIVMVTSFKDLKIITKGYEYNIFRFILKEEIDTEISNTIKAVIYDMQYNKRIISIKSEREIINCRLIDIYGLYSEGHYIVYQLKNKTIRSRYALNLCKDFFLNNGFISIRSNTLVNTMHISNFSRKHVRMDNEIFFDLSRQGYLSLKKEFINLDI